ncbi:MAG: sugar nucleotide-binding protein, partial [Patescibacteria group bacterium]|nr:sugar nucleotide-binding protein [Patescibacteria group bacterium]
YYGITKYRAEQMVRQSGLSHLILRTDQPYCWTEKWQHTNSVLRVLQSLRLGKIHREISDWYNTPTYVPDIALVTGKLIDRNCTGTYHVVGPDFVSRYDWALKIADIFGENKDLIEPVTSCTLNLPAKRVNVNLSNQKVVRDTGIRMSGIEKGLMNMLKDTHHE